MLEALEFRGGSAEAADNAAWALADFLRDEPPGRLGQLGPETQARLLRAFRGALRGQGPEVGAVLLQALRGPAGGLVAASAANAALGAEILNAALAKYAAEPGAAAAAGPALEGLKLLAEIVRLCRGAAAEAARHAFLAAPPDWVPAALRALVDCGAPGEADGARAEARAAVVASFDGLRRADGGGSCPRYHGSGVCGRVAQELVREPLELLRALAAAKDAGTMEHAAWAWGTLLSFVGPGLRALPTRSVNAYLGPMTQLMVHYQTRERDAGARAALGRACCTAWGHLGRCLLGAAAAEAPQPEKAARYVALVMQGLRGGSAPLGDPAEEVQGAAVATWGDLLGGVPSESLWWPGINGADRLWDMIVLDGFNEVLKRPSRRAMDLAFRALATRLARSAAEVREAPREEAPEVLLAFLGTLLGSVRGLVERPDCERLWTPGAGDFRDLMGAASHLLAEVAAAAAGDGGLPAVRDRLQAVRGELARLTDAALSKLEDDSLSTAPMGAKCTHRLETFTACLEALAEAPAPGPGRDRTHLLAVLATVRDSSWLQQGEWGEGNAPLRDFNRKWIEAAVRACLACPPSDREGGAVAVAEFFLSGEFWSTSRDSAGSFLYDPARGPQLFDVVAWTVGARHLKDFLTSCSAGLLPGWKAKLRAAMPDFLALPLLIAESAAWPGKSPAVSGATSAWKALFSTFSRTAIEDSGARFDFLGRVADSVAARRGGAAGPGPSPDGMVSEILLMECTALLGSMTGADLREAAGEAGGASGEAPPETRGVAGFGKVLAVAGTFLDWTLTIRPRHPKAGARHANALLTALGMTSKRVAQEALGRLLVRHLAGPMERYLRADDPPRNLQGAWSELIKACTRCPLAFDAALLELCGPALAAALGSKDAVLQKRTVVFWNKALAPALEAGELSYPAALLPSLHALSSQDLERLQLPRLPGAADGPPGGGLPAKITDSFPVGAAGGGPGRGPGRGSGPSPGTSGPSADVVAVRETQPPPASPGPSKSPLKPALVKRGAEGPAAAESPSKFQKQVHFTTQDLSMPDAEDVADLEVDPTQQRKGSQHASQTSPTEAARPAKKKAKVSPEALAKCKNKNNQNMLRGVKNKGQLKGQLVATLKQRAQAGGAAAAPGAVRALLQDLKGVRWEALSQPERVQAQGDLLAVAAAIGQTFC